MCVFWDSKSTVQATQEYTYCLSVLGKLKGCQVNFGCISVCGTTNTVGYIWSNNLDKEYEPLWKGYRRRIVKIFVMFIYLMFYKNSSLQTKSPLTSGGPHHDYVHFSWERHNLDAIYPNNRWVMGSWMTICTYWRFSFFPVSFLQVKRRCPCMTARLQSVPSARCCSGPESSRNTWRRR